MTGRIRWLKPMTGCIAAVVLGVSGCDLGPDYKSPVFAFMNSYRAGQSGAPRLLSNAAWWKTFGDPALDALVMRALSGSLDLEIAKERVIEARANLHAVPGPAEAVPSVSVEREGGRRVPDRTRGEAELGFDWLLDPFGERRNRLRAAGARLEVAEAEVNAARLLLLLNLGNAYVDLRFNQRTLILRQRQLASRRKTMDLTKRLFDQNSATRLDVVRTEALVNETLAQIPPVRAAIARNKFQIAVLVGVTPGHLDLNLDGGGSSQPRPRMAPDVGIPADLLRNRPDIMIAERQYYASVAEIGVARAALYPRLSLGGTVSLAAIEGGASTAEYGFGPKVTFPSIFSDDTRAARDAADSRARQAYTRWHSTVLEAIRDVESALVDYSGNLAAVQAAQRSARLFREASELTRELILKDGATILDLIDAEQSVATADIALTSTLRQLALSYISLNINLGSGNDFGGVPPTGTDG